MMKSHFCRRNFLIYYISICLVYLGIFIYQPQIANAKMVNKSDSSQKIDLTTFNPNQQEAQQLEELKASGDSDGTSFSNEVIITIVVIGVIFFGYSIYRDNSK
jgi:hypothetical protein